MGYNTSFFGSFEVTPALSEQHRIFLTKFSRTRRMARNVGPEHGTEGEWYVDGKGMCGQDNDDTIMDSNRHPSTQPGFWCQWIPNNEGTEMVWDEGEKFYEYVEWIEYLVKEFFIPNVYVLDGEVKWDGEDSSDLGRIIIENNVVSVKHGRVIYE